MTLAIHQNTSSGAWYRGSLEGWSRAGIKNVELTEHASLDGFLKTESLPAAKRVLTDLGLTPVSCASGVFGALWEPGANRPALLDNFKKRCEQFAALGLTNRSIRPQRQRSGSCPMISRPARTTCAKSGRSRKGSA